LAECGTPPASDATTWISLFDLFRIGIGPSSSHTVGPMLAAGRFRAECALVPEADRLQVDLFGSLALTGRGHATDTAVMLGLLGEAPDRVDPDAVPALVAGLRSRGAVQLPDGRTMAFNPDVDLVFRRRETLPFHPNAMRIALLHDGNVVLERIYYSVGGGFVVEEGAAAASVSGPAPPHGFTTAAEMLVEGARVNLTIAELQRANERTRRSDEDISAGIHAIWTSMRDCVQRGLRHGGELPGGLRVRRRAAGLHARLLDASNADPLRGMDWVNMWALAVNEENASGGRVVTAPTNGAAGIVPAVLHYYDRFVPGADRAGIETFLLAAAAVGGIIKRNASISGAEVGCQGEVGSACAMAAAGLAAALGGDNRQVENAAEIGLEHNLGLTCDPIGGLVQVPCIERNAIAATKAINAARLALHGDGVHRVSLDQAISTMRDTGRDMLSKYKETSEGGLAVNAVEC
jgi:L-serine dehydratase